MNEDILGYTIIGSMLSICAYMHYSNSYEFQLKCIVSEVDGNKYCVRERKQLKNAVDLLAKTTMKCKQLVQYMHKKYPDKDNVKRLVDGFNPQKVMETLPTSSYTAYSENKGEKIAFCLGSDKKDLDNLIDQNTLMFVALHELSHLATKTIGHDETFWKNFKFILQESEKIGIYKPINYKSTATSYCGTTIRDNPYYDV